jgi:L-alanine-DL-glutamate epimerase-like enolase superfamily enzyme
VPPTADAARALTLARTLIALPLTVDGAACAVGLARVPSYPGGRRPTSVITLTAGDAAGRGEHVGWTEAAHAAFAETVRGLPRGRGPLGDWMADAARRLDERYDRAAVEAAAIDLALRQHGTNLFRLAGAEPGPVRYVVSFGRMADPIAEAARHPGVELKIDVDPGWDDGAYRRLAELGRVAVLDFKGAGTTVEHERAHHALPAALIEDPGVAGPWSASLRRRLAFDAPLGAAVDLDALPTRPAAVNLKPARMGGVLEVLATIARAAEGGIAVYLGGMFEVGVGRTQLRELAALFGSDGPNDIAPIAVDDAEASRPPRLPIDTTGPGFGSARADRPARR